MTLEPVTMNCGEGAGWVTRVSLPQPSLKDNTADVDRLKRALGDAYGLNHIHVDMAMAKTLPGLLRENHYTVRCLVIEDQGRGTLVYAGPDDSAAVLAGVAVDLGTTRVAMRLLNLSSCQPMAETSFDNPQTTIGADILARIHYADQTDGLATLNQLIVDGINSELNAMCQSCGISTDHIYLMSVAGNTTMSHLLTGMPVHWMIREPYIPTANHFGFLAARELGLHGSPQAKALLFPNVGSYFGGDVIAGILFSQMHRHTETAILVDVGTNAEVVLGNRDWLIACAGAAGPALEGGMSQIGATAAPGVIDQVAIDSHTHEFDLHTIDGKAPVGICGSGIIDLAAHLYLTGMIDVRGKLIPDACGGRWQNRNDLPRLSIVPGHQSADGRDLCISQADLDSLVRSKAAMYTILETIAGTMGIQLDTLETFYVAGTFGSLINPQSAITIGMMPDLPLERYHTLGNSSLGGASLALCRRTVPEEIAKIRDSITYMELNVNQDFMNRFSAAKFIPHTDKSRFPSVP